MHVKAGEPIPETFEHLKRNLALNRFDEQEVDARCLGLSDQVSHCDSVPAWIV